MRSERLAAELDRSNPTVARWLQECDLASTPVRMSLHGESKADIELQCRRLAAVFGPLIKMSKVRQNKAKTTYLAYGVFEG